MKSMPKRFILFIGLLILVSLACNTPIISNLLPGQSSGDDPGASGNGPGTSPSDQVIPHNTDGAEVTFISGATFQMGSELSDEDAGEGEFPQHQVTLSDFYIYTYEVTNQMYAGCVESGYCMSPLIKDGGPSSHYSDPAYAEYPVVGVDWLMARDYCAWAGGRLPTEAEWELASRGPESLLYPWGEEEPTCNNVNMGGCLVPPDTQPVGHYLLGNSPYEVWDMSGNVWEWTYDWYGDNYYSQSPEHNPIGPSGPQDPENPLRAIRGGGLNSGPEKMRAAYRMGLNPHRPFTDVGFRCVTGQGISLPAAYDPGEEYHERVPPDTADGGDSADDDPSDLGYIRSGDIFGPCPDGSGTLRLIVPASASDPIREMMVRYDGDHWDPECIHDPATSTAICEGPEPPGYLTMPPPSFPLDVCIDIGYTGICFEGVPVWKPTDCESPDEGTEFEVDAFVGCRDTETPALVAHFTPEDAPFGGAGTSMRGLECDPLPEEGFYICTGLPSPMPGTSLDGVDIHFRTSDGRSDTVAVTVPDCSVSIWINPHCVPPEGGTGPAVLLQISGVEDELISLEANGTSLSCTDFGHMIYNCSGLTGSAGDPVVVTATFASGGVLSGTTRFPDCDDSAGNMTVEPVCGYMPGYDGLIPIFSIDIDVDPAEIDSIVVYDTVLECDEYTEDPFYCWGYTGWPAGPVTIAALLVSGDVLTDTIDLPLCIDRWTLNEVGCLSEVEYYALIYTGLDERFLDFHLEDVPDPKICSQQLGRPEYWYCNFPINDWYTTLTFCAEWIGGPGEYCETFPEHVFADRLPSSCVEPGDAGGHSDPCSGFTSSDCTAGPRANFCTWTGSACVSQ